MPFDWKSLVRTVAPGLATALGGPLAGWAMGAISTAILGQPNGSEAEIEQALASATPDHLLALKKANQDFTVKMKELDIDLERIDAEDRRSARDMQMETRSWIPASLALLVTLGYFGVLAYMLRFGLPKEVAGNEALLLIVGGLSTAWVTVITFYFGSSASSKAKDDSLKAAIRNGK
mgnify:CR=1 FL=1